MAKRFDPRLDALPNAQKEIWAALSAAPRHPLPTIPACGEGREGATGPRSPFNWATANR